MLRLTSALVILVLSSAVSAEVADSGASLPTESGLRVPTLFLIGDSTVRNGSGKGDNGLWGWGNYLVDHFNKSKINVSNRALGGRSSRTFLTEGLWDKVLADIKPGDFVMMQFGHNDGGPIDSGKARASLKGNADDFRHVVIQETGQEQDVHSYGWYMRKYICDAKAKGATAIVLSSIPRNIWKNGKVARNANDYGKWAAEAAKAQEAYFIDLNEIVAAYYELEGQEKVQSEYFTSTDHTHTTAAGARLNAQCVVEGLAKLHDCPLKNYLAADQAWYKFAFSPGKAMPAYIQVFPATIYSKELGYGFDLDSVVSAIDNGGDDPLRSGFCTAEKPFFFSVALPEGNYNVTVTMGDKNAATNTTIKAESRRLMLEKIVTKPGEFVSRTFTVNIRTPKIESDGEVKLKPREKGPPLVLHWDHKLTLEFNGPRPCICTMEICRLDDAVTIYLAGDSTVTDQPLEPWNSWGQMLPRFFKPGVAIANHAESGESLKSFIGEKRLDKIWSTLKAGDYLFIQFGHNDQKDKSPDAGAFESYKDNLKRFVAEARKRGTIPVLITSTHRLRFDAEGKIENTLGDYPEAVRQAAQEENTPLIDLNAMSRTFYEALGPQNAKQAFQDGAHHNNYGSYELARCVVEGIKANKLGLVEFLVDDVPAFDPDRPDPIETFVMPASPQSSTEKPEGN